MDPHNIRKSDIYEPIKIRNPHTPAAGHTYSLIFFHWFPNCSSPRTNCACSSSDHLPVAIEVLVVLSESDMLNSQGCKKNAAYAAGAIAMPCYEMAGPAACKMGCGSACPNDTKGLLDATYA